MVIVVSHYLTLNLFSDLCSLHAAFTGVALVAPPNRCGGGGNPRHNQADTD